MNKTAKIVRGLGIAAISLATSSHAQTFDLTFTDYNSVVQGYGAVTGTPNGDGTYTVTSGFWDVVAGPEAGLTENIFASPNVPNVVISPSGYFAYNDQLNPFASQAVDYWGLLFAGPGAPSEINLFSDAPNQYEEYFNNGLDIHGTLAVQEVVAATPAAEVPDSPSTSLLLGMAGVALLSVRKLAIK